MALVIFEGMNQLPSTDVVPALSVLQDAESLTGGRFNLVWLL